MTVETEKVSQSPRPLTELSAYIFSTVVGITIVVYLLRGFGVLAFMPGGVIWLLVLLSVATGIIYGIVKNKRF